MGYGTLLGYHVYRTESAVTTRLTSAPINALTYTDSSSPLGIKATYTISAVQTQVGGEGPQSAPSGTESAALPPGAPTITAIAQTASGQLAISWSAAAANGSIVSNYRLDYLDASSVSQFVNTAGTVTAIGSLVNGHAYSFTVTASNNSGQGGAIATGPSSAAVIGTPATTPNAVGTVTATKGDTIANVSWASVNAQGATGLFYGIYRTGAFLSDTIDATQTSGAGIFWPSNSYTIASGIVTYHDFNVTNGVNYTYAVVASGIVSGARAYATFSPGSNTVTPSGLPLGMVAPTVSASPLSAPVPHTLHVTWGAAFANGSAITGYRILRNDWVTFDVGVVTSYDDTTVIGGTGYSYQILAKNGSGIVGNGGNLGWAAFYSPVSAWVAAYDAPTQPPPLTVVDPATGGQLNLSWTVPATSGGLTPDALMLHEYNGPSTPTPIFYFNMPLPSAWPVTGLTNGVQYGFYITFHNAAGWSPLSTIAVGTPH